LMMNQLLTKCWKDIAKIVGFFKGQSFAIPF